MTVKQWETLSRKVVTFTPDDPQTPDKGSYTCSGCGITRAETHATYAEEHAGNCRRI